VKEGLQQLKLSGYKIGLVTNKQRNLVFKSSQFRSIANLFDTIVTVDDVTIGKPSPEPIIKAIHILEVRPKQVVMVGDSRYDVLSAHAAHVKSAVLDWYGLGNWGEPVPDYRFRSLYDFIEQVYTIDQSAI
jgi:pyrophosphatase PpaX